MRVVGSVDERVLAAAVLSLLRVLAREMPVLVAVDDLQWLDPRSARLLGFSGRRLERDRVGFVATIRLDDPAGARGADPADLVVQGIDPDLLMVALYHATFLADPRAPAVDLGSLARHSPLLSAKPPVSPSETGVPAAGEPSEAAR